MSTRHVMCPLSGSPNVIPLEIIKVKDLIKLYNQLLNLDISSEFLNVNEIGLYRCSDCDLRFFYPAITGSEKFYDALQEFNWYYMDNKKEYDMASEFISPDDEVLEIGAGKGVFAGKISCKSYLGLELSEKAKVQAQANGVKIVNQLIQAHALNNKRKYDVVCSFQVLEHVKEIHSFIKSCLVCLKPGGLLIYSVPSADSFLSFAQNSILNLPPHHISHWTDQALKAMARIFPLEVIAIEHEKLADIHIDWYASTVSLKGIKDLLGMDNKTIDLSFSGKLINKISSWLGRIYAKGINNIPGLPDGHSVTIVYRKIGEIE